MENIIVSSLKLGLLGFFVFLIGIVIDLTFKRLGFYKRDWIFGGVLGVIIAVFSTFCYIYLNSTENSYKALRGSAIFIGWIFLGVIAVCLLFVFFRNFIKKREILFISPNPSNFSEEKRVRVEKYLGNLRKTRSCIHFHVFGASLKGQSRLDVFDHLVRLVSIVSEIHIWRTDNCNNETAFILGVYLYHRYLFRGKNIVVVNNGGSLLCSQNTIDKILCNLEWSGY